MKYTVQAVILNDNNEVLAVSRKHDHNDFGLVGGGVESYDETHKHAIVRETKEETGLDILTTDLELVLATHKDGWMSYTYLVSNYNGSIYTEEPHIVKWTTFDEICAGSFGKYNKMVRASLKDMGIKIK